MVQYDWPYSGNWDKLAFKLSHFPISVKQQRGLIAALKTTLLIAITCHNKAIAFLFGFAPINSYTCTSIS